MWNNGSFKKELLRRYLIVCTQQEVPLEVFISNYLSFFI